MSSFITRSMRQNAIPVLRYVPSPTGTAFTVFCHVKTDRDLSRTVHRTVHAPTPAEARAKVREQLIREGFADPRFAYYEEVAE